MNSVRQLSEISHVA